MKKNIGLLGSLVCLVSTVANVGNASAEGTLGTITFPAVSGTIRNVTEYPSDTFFLVVDSRCTLESPLGGVRFCDESRTESRAKVYIDPKGRFVIPAIKTGSGTIFERTRLQVTVTLALDGAWTHTAESSSGDKKDPYKNIAVVNAVIGNYDSKGDSGSGLEIAQKDLSVITVQEFKPDSLGVRFRSGKSLEAFVRGTASTDLIVQYTLSWGPKLDQQVTFGETHLYKNGKRLVSAWESASAGPNDVPLRGLLLPSKGSGLVNYRFSGDLCLRNERSVQLCSKMAGPARYDGRFPVQLKSGFLIEERQ